jgi:hypothetical protein
MDPDAALEELQKLATEIRGPSQHAVCYPDDAQRMAELFIGLDHWLFSGGALPGLWSMHRGQQA